MTLDDPKMGIEIEIAGVSRRHLRAMFDHPLMRDSFPNVTIGDDGSLRAQTYTMGGDAVQLMHSPRSGEIVPAGGVPSDVVGPEIITSPMCFSEWEEPARLMAKMFGHLAVNARSSIHIHTDFHNLSWRRIQNYIHWFYALEAPLYRLARMGDLVHRGSLVYQGTLNDHRYARPLSDSIGMLAYRRTGCVPCIAIESLIKAKYASEMLAHWGRLDMMWSSLRHYTPHRLHGLNITSLIQHGTLELRIFNGGVRFLPQAIKIAHGLYKLSERPVPKDFPTMPLGSRPQITLSKVSELLNIDPNELRPIWRIEAPKEWVAGCETHSLMHHYTSDTSMWYNINSYHPVLDVINSMGIHDTHQDDFILAPEQEEGFSPHASRFRSGRRMWRAEDFAGIRQNEPEQDDNNDDDDFDYDEPTDEQTEEQD